MNIFDLHCDTLNRCLDHLESLMENNGQLDIRRGIRNGGWVQVFACWISRQYQGEEAFARFLAQRAVLMDALVSHPEVISAFSPQNSPAPGRCQAVLSVEGGHVLGGRLENISRIRKLGVAMLTLVWNGDNELGSGAVEGQPRGLTPFGRECVLELTKNGIVIDISHLNDNGIEDVLQLTDLPVAASHSNLRSVCSNPRNLADSHFRELVRRKGICGVNFYPPFVTGQKDYPVEALLRQIERMLALGGEDIIAIGSDFDGADMPSFLPDVESICRLYDAVVKWFGEEIADKLFYNNAAAFVARNFKVEVSIKERL